MITTALMLALLPPLPAATQAEAACSATTVPPEYKGWEAMQGVTAGTSVAAPATLAMGRSARATLAPAAAVKFPVAPEKPAPTGTNGGVFAFDVTSAGTYRVALGGAGWVDVVGGGKLVPSSAHGHGPDCSGIRKIVDFKLTPGRYLIQASGLKADTLAVMVTKLD